MMKQLLGSLCATVMLTSQTLGVSPYFEDFETGVDGWSTWVSALGPLTLDTAHNHTSGFQSTPGNPIGLPAGHAFKGPEAAPGGFASFTTIADGTGALRVDVWVLTLNATPDVDDSRAMLQLSQGASSATDYLQIGWLQDYAGGSERFSIRTRRRDQLALGTFDTGILRPLADDWVKISIAADAAVGGNVRFYINDVLAYTGVGERLGANLNTIRLGVNFGNNNDAVWYDDLLVSVIPESSHLGLAGMTLMVGVAILRRRLSCR